MSSGYEAIRRIGEGAYGKAILVRKKSNNQRCVIKEVMLSRMRSHRERESAKQEVELLKQFDHPAIVHYLDSFEEAGSLHIVMEYCDGGDLSSRISSQRSPFPEDQVIDWFAQMCLALKYVHDKHVIHRDIKPQNIFLMRSGQVKLGDFGVAKTLDCTLQLASTAIGTPYYVSPEIVKSEAYNNKTDIWSLGCVLYELLTLNHAFEAKNEKQLYINIKLGNVMPVSPRYSSEIRSICSAMFRKNPRDRPTVHALLKKEVLLPALLKHISAEEVAAIQQGSPSPAAAAAAQRRPGSATRPSSAASARKSSAAAAAAVAGAAYPAAPLSPYAQRLGGNDSAAAAAARRRDQERLAVIRKANELQNRQRQQQQQQQREREQEEARRRQQREEAWINMVSPSPSPSASPSPSPRGDYANYHAALDNLARDAQQRPRQPQPPAASPSPSPSPSPAASDDQSQQAQRLLEDFWERKRLAARIKAQGLGLGAAQAVNPLSPRPAAAGVEETYLRRLEEVRRRNQRERQQLGEAMQLERQARETKIDALKAEARDRANRLREQMDERFREASERQQQQQHYQRQQVQQYPPPPSVSEVMRKLLPVNASDSEPTTSGGVAGGGGITRVLAEIAGSASASASASSNDLADEEAAQRRRQKKESILRYINRKGEPPSIQQQQQKQPPLPPPPPQSQDVGNAWSGAGRAVGDRALVRLDQLPLQITAASTATAKSSASDTSSTPTPNSPTLDTATAAAASTRPTPRAWGARADDTGFLRRLGNAPILSGTLVDGDDDRGEGDIEGADEGRSKDRSLSVLSPAEAAEAAAAAAATANAVAEAETMASAGRAKHVVMEPELSGIPELGESSLPSISDSKSLLDQVALEEPDNHPPVAGNRTSQDKRVDLERTDMQQAIYQSLKDFALSAAAAAAANENDVEAAEQLLLSSLALEEAEELAEVERSFRRVLDSQSAERKDAASEDEDSQCDRTLKQALTTGKFDSPKSLLRTCSLPDLVDETREKASKTSDSAAAAAASGDISVDTLVSLSAAAEAEASVAPSRRGRRRPASSSQALMSHDDDKSAGNEPEVELEAVDQMTNDENEDYDDEELDQVKQSMASVLALSADAAANGSCGSGGVSAEATTGGSASVGEDDGEEVDWDDDEGLPMDERAEDEDVDQKAERLRAELELEVGLDRLLQAYELAFELEEDPSVSELETERRVKAVLGEQHAQLYDKIMTLLFYDNPN